LAFAQLSVVFSLFSWNQKTHAWNITTALRPAIVNLDWQKGGKTVFKSVNFAGYVGILTAIKPVSTHVQL
jgi:acid ceramidase